MMIAAICSIVATAHCPILAAAMAEAINADVNLRLVQISEPTVAMF